MKNSVVIFFYFITFLGYSQKNMPNIRLITLNGKNISTSTDFNEKNKIYVFAFWATWCAPCIQELNAIADEYDTWKQELNLEIVAVSIDDSRTVKRVKPLVNGKNWNYTVLLDTNQELKRAIGFANPPYIIVVKNNEIVFSQNGHSPGSEEAFFEKLKTYK